MSLSRAACFVLLVTLAACPPKPTANPAVATIGPDGGVLRADGVEVTIPAGAMNAAQELTLTVGDDAAATVLPHVEFDKPVTVKMDGARWPIGGPRLAVHRTDGENYLLGLVIENADGSWQYETLGFDTTLTVPTTIVTTPAELWATGYAWMNRSELAQTSIHGADADDVSRDCLASVGAGLLHDTVTKTTGTPSAKRDDDEYALMTAEAATAFREARMKLQQDHPEYDIWLNGAWDSSQSVHHAADSLHYIGAALDLGIAVNGMKTHDPEILGLLPQYLVNAKFTWVFYEDAQHVHASITSPSLKSCGSFYDSARWDEAKWK